MFYLVRVFGHIDNFYFVSFKRPVKLLNAYVFSSAGQLHVPSSLKRLCRNSSSRPSPSTWDASRDPDNVSAKAGNQPSTDVIELSLDSPSTLLRVVSLSNHGSCSAKRSSSGMTGSANCDIVSKEREDFLRS
jgi:hypothetical protein